MKFYDTHILPKLLDYTMRSFDRERSSVIGVATGVVLEVGFGSGRNLPFYGKIEKLIALEPSSELVDIARERVKEAPFPVEFILSGAEQIPLADASVDTVVSTWTLCTIPDVSKALGEVRRVLKPGGKFLCIEHGKSPGRFAYAVQKALTPTWKRLAGGCHLDRDIEALVRGAGFSRVDIAGSERRGKPLAFSYSGTAER